MPRSCGRNFRGRGGGSDFGRPQDWSARPPPVSCWWPHWRLIPTAQLLQDLPLLENYDQYRVVGSIEFLRALSAENPFPADTVTAAALPVYNPAATNSQRRKVVESMTPDRSKELFDTERKFREYSSPEEQQRLLKLYADIESDPNREKLLAIMNRYCEWFDGLPLPASNDLQQRNPVDRAVQVKKMLDGGQFAGIDIRLDEASRQGLARWLDRFIADHETQILQQVAAVAAGNGRTASPGPRPNVSVRPDIDAAGGLAKLSPQRKRLFVGGWLLRYLLSDKPVKSPPLSEGDMANLRASLSKEIREKLDARPPKERHRIIAAWLRETLWPDLDEQLVEYFDKLSPDVRDRLMALPVDDMYHELYSAYVNSGEGPRIGDPRNFLGGRRGGRGPRGGGGRRFMELSSREPPTGPEPSGSKALAAQSSASAKSAEKSQQ